jgi:hypothetical protein
MERCPSWPKEHDWKSCRRHKRLEGSNPSLSATIFLVRPVGQVVKTPPFHGGNRGSSPLRVTIFTSHGGLAQLGEHLPYKQRVGGSIPSASITFPYERLDLIGNVTYT